MSSKKSLPRRVLRALWNGVTRVRLALSNLLFLAMLAIIYFVYIGGAQEPLPEKAALLLNMAGTVVEQKAPVDPLAAILREPSAASHEVLLRDVLGAIEMAADDPAINALVMELDSLVYVGISKTQEILRTLEDFRASLNHVDLVVREAPGPCVEPNVGPRINAEVVQEAHVPEALSSRYQTLSQSESSHALGMRLPVLGTPARIRTSLKGDVCR